MVSFFIMVPFLKSVKTAWAPTRDAPTVLFV
jgi:hypothetical protein